MNSHRSCPHCGNLVAADVEVCSRCDRELPAVTSFHPQRILWAVAVLLGVWAISLLIN